MPASSARQNAAAAFLADAENLALELAGEFTHPVYGRLRQPGALLSIDSRPMVAPIAPPTLGEHSRIIMSEAGYQPRAIAELEERGVIVQREPQSV